MTTGSRSASRLTIKARSYVHHFAVFICRLTIQTGPGYYMCLVQIHRFEQIRTPTSTRPVSKIKPSGALASFPGRACAGRSTQLVSEDHPGGQPGRVAWRPESTGSFGDERAAPEGYGRLPDEEAAGVRPEEPQEGPAPQVHEERASPSRQHGVTEAQPAPEGANVSGIHADGERGQQARPEASGDQPAVVVISSDDEDDAPQLHQPGGAFGGAGPPPPPPLVPQPPAAPPSSLPAAVGGDAPRPAADAGDGGDPSEATSCVICLDVASASGPHRLCSLKCGHLFGASRPPPPNSETSFTFPWSLGTSLVLPSPLPTASPALLFLSSLHRPLLRRGLDQGARPRRQVPPVQRPDPRLRRPQRLRRPRPRRRRHVGARRRPRAARGEGARRTAPRRPTPSSFPAQRVGRSCRAPPCWADAPHLLRPVVTRSESGRRRRGQSPRRPRPSSAPSSAPRVHLSSPGLPRRTACACCLCLLPVLPHPAPPRRAEQELRALRASLEAMRQGQENFHPAGRRPGGPGAPLPPAAVRASTSSGPEQPMRRHSHSLGVSQLTRRMLPRIARSLRQARQRWPAQTAPAGASRRPSGRSRARAPRGRRPPGSRAPGARSGCRPPCPATAGVRARPPPAHARSSALPP